MGKERRPSGRLKARESRGAEMELKQPVAERVAAYALAAGAAGLGIMAGAQPAEAQIVYTPAHIHFEKGALLDLNDDGTNDFLISQNWYCRGTSCPLATLSVAGAPGNAVDAKFFSSSFPAYALRLTPGAKIGPGETFVRGRKVRMAHEWSFSYCFGYWENACSGASGFLGLEFQIDGQAHYGWAEVLITGGGAFSTPYRGVVKGYAYNTVPNQPILAGQRSDANTIGEIPPQPATLGLLALGPQGLDVWRPRKRQLTAQ